MAKASRSKKQPDFDPTELSDLIYTPAVGKGVGSHLLESNKFIPSTPDLSTVAESNLSTVDEISMATVADLHPATVDESGKPTVDRFIVWITEEGTVVPQGRVRRIGVAEDAVSRAEQLVYQTLCSAQEASGDEAGERIVQAGYDYLVKRTHLSKRTIQRIVEKLIEKDFIAIERPADIYQRTSTVYRVFSSKTILDRHFRKGRLHVAKLGPGVSYVRRAG
jgi:predicted transcriptional regulator